ncbi:MAG: hypothetical protein MJ185_09245 [Treponema sp.]|nr:hypothetical protein [Treponema sp.]
MTNNSECSYVMDKFLELDRSERMPLWMTKHFLTCEECRSNVRMFTQAEKILRKEEDDENLFGFANVAEVKEKLYPGSTQPKRVPLVHWIVIGILLLICMVLCTVYTAEMVPVLKNFSFLFVAGFITVYVTFFIGFNMDLFVKH